MKRLILIILLLHALSTHAQTGLLFGSDRLTSTLIVKICQDKTGYIWIATEFGLNRFDGHHFTHYLHIDGDSTSLGHNVIASMLCDNSGCIWVGTIDGLQRYDEATDRFVNYHFPGGLKPRVSAILQCADGRILVGTSGYGVYTIKPESYLLELQSDLQADEKDQHFNHIFESPDGSLWKSGAGHFCYKQKDRHPQKLSSAFAAGRIFTRLLYRRNLSSLLSGIRIPSTSFLSESEAVAESLNLSISSFIEESFSI